VGKNAPLAIPNVNRDRSAGASVEHLPVSLSGIIPVLALFLIKFEWYWYLVFEVVFEVF